VRIDSIDLRGSGMKRTMVLLTAVLLATWAGSGTAAQTSVAVSATVTGTCKFVSGNSGTNRRLQGTATGDFIPITFTYTASGTGAGPTNPLAMDISGQIVGAYYSGASQDAYSDTVTLTINP
jgi:hypothetical protein